MLYLWYHPWYQAFYVGYQYRIGIEASDYKSISIVSVSKFQVLESISIVSVSNSKTLEVSVSYRYRKKRYRRALPAAVKRHSIKLFELVLNQGGAGFEPLLHWFWTSFDLVLNWFWIVWSCFELGASFAEIALFADSGG